MHGVVWIRRVVVCELFWHSVHSVYSVDERVFLTTDYTECTELCGFGELVCVNFFGILCTLCILWRKEFF